MKNTEIATTPVQKMRSLGRDGKIKWRCFEWKYSILVYSKNQMKEFYNESIYRISGIPIYEILPSLGPVKLL